MPTLDDGAASTKLVGTTLQSRYRLSRLIGRGGMGAVYEAVQVALNKRVAVKVMSRDLSANEEALARFRREADVTSQLGHPHIVQVFDFGETATGEPYLVMEYLDGEDLEQRLARVGRFSLAATVKVVKQVASALAATHARGIVHRDLKPGNVFLQKLEGEDDFVKVVDFGISKVHMATTRLTGDRAVLGTPGYMSPEQANGRIDDIDRRTDEWSLACIAYEMLAGHPPFRGDDASAVIYQIIYSRPSPVRASVPELPADVDQVLARALSKAQGERFATVPAFARALEAVAEGHSIPTDEVNLTSVELIAGEPPTARADGGPTTTFSNTAAEATGRSSRRARPPLGLYFVAVAVAASAALVLLSLHARRPVAARQSTSVTRPVPVATPTRAAEPARPSSVVPEPMPAAEPLQPPADVPQPVELPPSPRRVAAAPGPAVAPGAAAAVERSPAPTGPPTPRTTAPGTTRPLSPPPRRASAAPAEGRPAGPRPHLIQDL
jgi:serine/threonine protein kinase